LSDEGTRLNKFISETGMCSRREADVLIERGRVKVNGKVAEMGTRVTAADKVEVQGKLIRPANKAQAVYIAFNKPVGVVSVTEERVKDNIVDAVGHPRRVFPIGRLDKESEGLIFLTSDGDVVNKILRAGNAHEKEYEVTVSRHITEEFVRRMSSGIPILGTVTQPCPVRANGPFSFTIILTQGMNRQIRRMCEFLGYEVTKLKRTRIMNVKLGGLRTGEWRDLTHRELEEIMRMVANSSGTEEASTTPKPRPPPRSEPRSVPRGRIGGRGGRGGGRPGGRRRG